MSHSRAVALMILVTLLWSTAGVVTRHLEAARSFEVTFWRSFFNAAFLLVALWAWQRQALWQRLRTGGWLLWSSGFMWAVMYTCFMLALTLTTVANVLVTMALSPLVTALMARFVLKQTLAARTWAAIALAGVGIVWMYAQDLTGGESRHLLGTLVALGVPLAGSINWIILQHNGLRRPGVKGEDMLPAVLIGAWLSALLTLPLAWPMQASAHDLQLLAALGVFQLAIPCLLAVRLARVLSAPEVSLLALLEVIFGVLWVWLGAGEAPTPAVLTGGALVLLALGGNETLGLLKRGRAAQASSAAALAQNTKETAS